MKASVSKISESRTFESKTFESKTSEGNNPEGRIHSAKASAGKAPAGELKPVVTKEHGSWAVLFIPLITGALAARETGYLLPAFIISVFFIFMSYTPAEMLIHRWYKNLPWTPKLFNARKWFNIYFLTGTIAGSGLIIFSGRYSLLKYGLLAALFFFISISVVLIKRKNLWSDLSAMAGLTLSAPAVISLLDGTEDWRNIILWLLNFAFFASSAFYVHFRISLAALKKQELSLNDIISHGRLNILYHLILLFTLIFVIRHYPGMEFIGLAFLPMIIHVLAGTFRKKGKADFKKTGMAFLLYSFIFALGLALAL